MREKKMWGVTAKWYEARQERDDDVRRWKKSNLKAAVFVDWKTVGRYECVKWN